MSSACGGSAHPLSMIVAVIALIAAFSGTGAGRRRRRLRQDEAPQRQEHQEASRIAGNKLKNNTITGTQVNESKLGKVPSATKADSATSATDAATSATSATT